MAPRCMSEGVTLASADKKNAVLEAAAAAIPVLAVVAFTVIFAPLVPPVGPLTVETARSGRPLKVVVTFRLALMFAEQLVLETLSQPLQLPNTESFAAVAVNVTAVLAS